MTSAPGSASFKGFGAPALDFFRDLAARQDRTWFQDNKSVYEREVLAPMDALLRALSAEFETRGIPLTGDLKRSLFRIHRDTRFAKDKSPYKTHAGAVMFRQGAGKMSPGILYLHIDPLGCFTAAGFYRPEPEALDALREGIRVRPAEWQKLRTALGKARLALSDGDPVSRMPRGFEDMADSELAEDLRRRSFIVRRALSVREVSSAALAGRVIAFAETVLPLLRFGWRAIDEVK